MIAATGLTTKFSRHTVAQLWAWMTNHREPGGFLTTAKLAVLHQAALDACDANAGLKDGLIAQPDGWLPRLTTLAREHGGLLIADEVMTGWGRTGTLFA